jgi:hypothetical protein
MTIEFDDKGKIFTDIVSKVPVQVVVQTTLQLLRGRMHVRRGERIKDELDRDELFIAMTDVEVVGSEGQVLFQSPFIAVRRNQIVWVMPENEDQEQST